jgi:hypothetical protein
MPERKPGEIAAVLFSENSECPCVCDFRGFWMKMGVRKTHRGEIVVSLHDLDATLAHECHTFIRIPPIPDKIPQTIDFINSEMANESEGLFQGLKIGVNIREDR